MTYKLINELLRKSFVIYVPLSLLTPMLMYQWRDNNRLIMMDKSNSYHITQYASDEALRRVYEYQIKLGVFAFLMRNPHGFDNKELLEMMFSGNAKAEAVKQLNLEADQFKKYKMHQKPEVLNIRILRADRQRSFARITGQLIRHYVDTDGSRKTYTAEFELNIELKINYNTATNTRYPFVITNLKYLQNEHKENEK